MSYIIAFVAYGDGKREYPAQCFRNDLVENDEVVVRRSDHELKKAIVKRLQYLNWDCKSRIECKVSEAELDSNKNIILPECAPLVVGVATSDTFITSLRNRGWIPLARHRMMYRSIHAITNTRQIAHIFTRKNGVDIEVHPNNGLEKPKANSIYKTIYGEGMSVRHALAHTTFNLFEGLLRFSDSFTQDEENLDRYFLPQGSTDKRTDELRTQAEAERLAKKNKLQDGCELIDIYDAHSDGSGGPAYLSDGVWITSSGNLHDWGR